LKNENNLWILAQEYAIFEFEGLEAAAQSRLQALGEANVYQNFLEYWCIAGDRFPDSSHFTNQERTRS